MVEKEKNRIVLTDFSNFSVKSVLECGQVFRYVKYGENDYGIYSADKYARVKQNGNSVEIETDDPEYFYNYFDLDRDYGSICEKVAVNDIMRRAAEYGKGIRLLNQNLNETLFGFILSSNNNIKRIRKIVGGLCVALGEKTEYGYAFPTAEALASVPKSLFCELGCGYRAEYISKTAKALTEGFDLGGLKNLPTEQARKRLMSLYGVGGKVADCILLFGLRKTDCFPVDTWIEKVYSAYFSAEKKKPSEISRFFVDIFGEYSGYAQQYLFYFQRESIAKRR